MQRALNALKNWYYKEELTANPSKTVIILFTKKNKLKLKALTLNVTQ